MLPMLAIPFPAIDPVLVEFGPLAIRWYSLAYIGGVLIGWWYVGILDRKAPKAFNQRGFDNLVIFAILGIILGGRLGYVLFYQGDYFLENPKEILAVWKGGMSFHGGLIGVITAMYVMCRIEKIKYLPVMDLLACATPIGLCLGRISNFVNGELVGRVTDVSWGVLFPSDPDNPRHPSQLYQAGLEGFLLFIIMLCLVSFTRARMQAGLLSGAFLCGYAVFRTIAELFREPDVQLGFIVGELTMGQLLCVPMLMLGLYLMLFAKPRKET